MINQQEKDFLRLVGRSPDIGDGWRAVSNMLWPWVLKFDTPGLLELDHEKQRVRPTEKGQTLLDYAL